MTTDASLIADAYLSWLRSGTLSESLSEKVSELTTPFVDRHNDHIQVYAERQPGDKFLLTDDGYIWSELRSSGVETRGVRREELVQSLLAGHGVHLDGHALQANATIGDLGRKIHSLVQAMLSLDDLFVLAQPTVGPTFLHDVATFFDERDIRYTPAAKFSGRSGLDHLINFVIPKSRHAPERFVQVVNAPRRDRVENLLFAVADTRSARSAETEFYAILNDARRGIAPEVAAAFDAYAVKARRWSNRDDMVEELAA